MITKSILSLVGSFLFLLSFSVTSAHTSGLFFERPSGEYVIEVEYDTPVFRANEALRFGFVLEQSVSREVQEFDHVWIRVIDTATKDRLMATGLAYQSIGPTTLLYMFTRGGEYAFDLSFRDAQGQDIATTSISLVVEETQSIVTPLLLLCSLLAGVVALGGGFLWGRGRTW